jgi:hypothetical protein
MTLRTRQTCALAIAVSVIVGAGCGGGEKGGETCTGPEIWPHRSPANFREAYPPGDGEANRGDPTRTPFEWTLHLESLCERDVEVETACLIGEENDGGASDAEHFQLEGPEPSTVTRDTDGLMRLTYDRSQPNPDGDADQAAIVVQSNAENFPTLVVPVCARVIEEGDGTERELVTCDSPVSVPEGERDEQLCQSS